MGGSGSRVTMLLPSSEWLKNQLQNKGGTKFGMNGGERTTGKRSADSASDAPDSKIQRREGEWTQPAHRDHGVRHERPVGTSKRESHEHPVGASQRLRQERPVDSSQSVRHERTVGTSQRGRVESYQMYTPAPTVNVRPSGISDTQPRRVAPGDVWSDGRSNESGVHRRQSVQIQAVAPRAPVSVRGRGSPTRNRDTAVSYSHFKDTLGKITSSYGSISIGSMDGVGRCVSQWLFSALSIAICDATALVTRAVANASREDANESDDDDDGMVQRVTFDDPDEAMLESMTTVQSIVLLLFCAISSLSMAMMVIYFYAIFLGVIQNPNDMPMFGSAKKEHVLGIERLIDWALNRYDKAGWPIRKAFPRAMCVLWDTRYVAIRGISYEIYNSRSGKDMSDIERFCASALGDALRDVASLLVPTAPSAHSAINPLYYTLMINAGKNHALVNVPLHVSNALVVLLLVDLIERRAKDFGALEALTSAVNHVNKDVEIKAANAEDVVTNVIKWLRASDSLGDAIRAYLRYQLRGILCREQNCAPQTKNSGALKRCSNEPKGPLC